MLAKSAILGVVAALVPVLQAAAADLDPRGGGMNLVDACQDQYGGQWAIAHSGNGKFDWYCVNLGNGATGGLDLNAYCARTYGSGSVAKSDKGGLYDWYCT